MKYHGVHLSREWLPFYKGRAFLVRRLVITVGATVVAAICLLQAVELYQHGFTRLSIWGLVSMWGLGLWITPAVAVSVALGWLLCLREASLRGLALAGVGAGLYIFLSLLYLRGFPALPLVFEIFLALPLATLVIPFITCDFLFSVTQYFCFHMPEWKWIDGHVNSLARQIRVAGEEMGRR